MTRDDIIRMAREAGLPVFDTQVTATDPLDQVIAEAVTSHFHESAICFAKLVAAAENEACAELCCSHEKLSSPTIYLTGYTYAQAIRARREQ